eukprot:4222952-Lingulodinium_polyedra.AAC.1
MHARPHARAHARVFFVRVDLTGRRRRVSARTLSVRRGMEEGEAAPQAFIERRERPPRPLH